MTAFRFEEVGSRAENAACFQLDVPEESSFFDGHFEGDPILPGVVQVCDIVLDRIEACWPSLGAPTSIPRVKFTQPIRPKARLELQLELDPEKQSVRFSLTSNGTLASSGVLRFGAD